MTNRFGGSFSLRKTKVSLNSCIGLGGRQTIDEKTEGSSLSDLKPYPSFIIKCCAWKQVTKFFLEIPPPRIRGKAK